MKKLYSLRKDFTIIGITGKIGAGCSEVAKLLSSENFTNSLESLLVEKTSNTDQLKLNVCINYLKHEDNWRSFKIIDYKNVLLFHLFYEAIHKTKTKEESIEEIIKIIHQNGTSHKIDFKNRFDINDGSAEKIRDFLEKEPDWYDYQNESLTCDSLFECLKDKKSCKKFHSYFFNKFENTASEFYSLLNKIDVTKRTRLTHDLANNLRAFGSVDSNDFSNAKMENIYTIAETINRLIKNWKSNNEYTKIVIDSLKNSLELMYFKEKYSAFYTISTNKSELERKFYLRSKLQGIYFDDYKESILTDMLVLNDAEYKGGEVNKGEFYSPDIENCIQKSDYHIFYSKLILGKAEAKGKNQVLDKQNENIDKIINEIENYDKLSLIPQVAKLIALIHQPGIITPTAFERSMQVAFNAKANSGCISRQVGAVVTDESYSIKSVGWNDIPRFQVPCNLRSANDLINGKNSDHFSDFEKGEDGAYADNETFKTKITKEFDDFDVNNLGGRHCSFCFKTYHNAFEGEKNQVHTRSLHAEENAMLQISKYGGQGLKNGNLFTTASPCELCSKKAFQLGINNIFYIDPYPGIATKHILKNSKKIEMRPNLFMFQGAVGKTFHKLYDPFISNKDELAIRANIKPKENIKLKIKSITKDEEEGELILKLMKDPDFKEKIMKIKDEK
ncbi:hypothetical protein [Kordia zhangzhouensis]|uniref:hypothetical protein n=1 Tax=Kordia zhangzhouensis TaxID=1620405 RepID=UPI0007EC8F43|nr:hypothetical protein [Kordia zhangzhouensis]